MPSAKLLRTKLGILSSSLCLVLVPCYVLKTMHKLFTYSSPSLSFAVCVHLYLHITSPWQLQKVVQGNLPVEQLHWAVRHGFAEEHPHLITSNTMVRYCNWGQWFCWFLFCPSMFYWIKYKSSFLAFVQIEACINACAIFTFWWNAVAVGGMDLSCGAANFLCPYFKPDIWHVVFILATITCTHNKLSGSGKD